MDIGGGSSPPIPLEIDAFKKLVASCGNRKGSPIVQQFLTKVANIPSAELFVERPCHTTLNLVERGLTGKFTGLWPSPKAIDGWVQRNWRPLITEGIHNHLVGRGYYVFVFDSVED